MDLTFLAASDGTPLAKQFTLSPRGITKQPYPLVKNFNSYIEEIETIDHFFAAISDHAAVGNCLLKGKLLKELTNEPRAGQHDLEALTEWCVIDIDDLKGFEELNDVMAMLALDVDHIVQYSASMGVDPTKALSAHVFFLLSSPVSPKQLKDWLIHLNLSIPALRSQVRLSASHMAPVWPVDPTVAQSDKLIYIAPPLLHGIEDRLTEPRISLVRGAQRAFALPEVQDTRKAKDALVNELRVARGLSERKFHIRNAFGTELLRSPDTAQSWRVAYQARGFTYLNLNGGDSAAYWHPDDDYSVLYNFKGEPNYSIKELIPEYFAQKTAEARDQKRQATEALKAEAAAKREENRNTQAQRRAREVAEAAEDTRAEFEQLEGPGLRYIIAEDHRTGLYYRGTYDFESGELRIHPARNRQSLIDFALQNVGFKPAYIPQWRVEYDFTTLQRIDVASKFINLFEPTRYMTEPSMAISEPLADLCPRILQVITHTLGDDLEVRDHFLNWLAFIWQYRRKTMTSWVLHGTQGTGKGLLFHRILRPLFGDKLAQIRTLDMLEESYNSYMQHTLLLFVDESTTDKVKNLAKVVNKVKNWITDPSIPIRQMHLDQFDAYNFANVMFASNRNNVIQIEPHDRRFNVAPRQEQKLVVTDQFLAELHTELHAFASWLQSRKVDEDMVRTPISTAAKQDIQDSTSDAPSDVAIALKEGNLRFFIGQLPQQDLALDAINPVATEFKNVVKWLVDSVRESGEADLPLLREEVQTLFQHCVGWERQSPHKFTKAASRYGLRIAEHWMPREGKTLRGFRTTWKVSSDDVELFDSLVNTNNKKLRVV